MKELIKEKDIFLFGLLFIVFTIVGTLSHELGHYLPAKLLGHNPVLHHASVSYHNPLSKQYYAENNRLKETFGDQGSIPSVEKKAVQVLRKQLMKESFIITIGGPLQTMMTGLLGLLVLFFRKEKHHAVGFVHWDWLAVFLSFFWSRQIFNSATYVYRQCIYGHPGRGDEVRLAKYLSWPDGSILLFTGVLGFLICSYVTFFLIAKSKRLSFIIGGILGSIMGYVIWMILIGPAVLP